MDFFRICTKDARGGVTEVYPDFIVGRSEDLMVRGKSFYAVWDEEAGCWSTNSYDAKKIVDKAIGEHTRKLEADGLQCSPKYLHSSETQRWERFLRFLNNSNDHYRQLDRTLTFKDTVVQKTDYTSKRLPYTPSHGDISAYDEMVGLLYTDEERAKFEWGFGAILAGDSRNIDKFLVFYGDAGTGKSTVMDIAQKLFEGYWSGFEAQALVNGKDQFGLSAFANNPLVAIQHDGDLSKIEDNSTLNSIISHETVQINEKHKGKYDAVIDSFLLMGTNEAVRIKNAKSGLLRRLIDVHPTGNIHEMGRYFELKGRIEFETAAIAQHCLDVYRKMGKKYYGRYRPLAMMQKTDVFFNFVEDHRDIFEEQNGASLKQAYAMYKTHCDETELGYKLPRYKFREEFKNYFKEFHDRIMIEGTQIRSYFQYFTPPVFDPADMLPFVPESIEPRLLVLDETESLLDDDLSRQPAQYANAEGNPLLYWTDEVRLVNGHHQKPKPSQVVSTVLRDIDTEKLHFVKLPENHIVIDFDLLGDDGEKSRERNLEAANLWPATYAEFSKSGAGVHLHYLYSGDASELATKHSEGIEVKVYPGNSSLRRRLTKCNALPIATISSGLPLKEKKMLQAKTIQSEKGLRDLIARNLRKEIHPGTKPSMDFIKHVLDNTYNSGVEYDVSDLRPRIMAFANNSSNQPRECLRVLQQMKFKSEEESVTPARTPDLPKPKDDRVVFFDVEVYPNLFVVCWKYAGSPTVVRMINPTAQEVEQLFQYKLVGFFNLDYDNHILWGRFNGMNLEQLYELSKRLVSNEKGVSQRARFGQAYGLSYADIYDYSSDKMSLKKWEIRLGSHHMEMDIPWDQPVPEERIKDVVEYCVNDVLATEDVSNYCEQDFVARRILAELSGLTVNDRTRKHAVKILFGNDRNPQNKFVYTDLSDIFPGYEFDEFSKTEKSKYRGEVVGEGGYVYSEPGIYENVVLLDVASMHPTSIEELNLFGEYTPKFSAIKAARLAIKEAKSAMEKGELDKANSKFDDAKRMFDGKLTPHLEAIEKVENLDDRTKSTKTLEEALKLVINSIYGYTAATFPNEFKDIRNKDNIVAKRGALFMINLKHMLQDLGVQVVHIKTDSIKIPNATSKIIEFVENYGKEYGYEFKHEATYDKFCLVNDAVYIAKSGDKWTAVGAQFQHPYVYKTLFSHEQITFDDLCETKSVMSGSALYLDFDESLANPNMPYEGMHFVGRVGSFLPVTESSGGGKLIRVKDEKTYAVTGTKGYLWVEAEMVKAISGLDVSGPFFDGSSMENLGGFQIDQSYFDRLIDEAIKKVEEFGSFKELVGQE